MARDPRPSFWSYLLWQLPSWGGVAVLVVLLDRLVGPPVWVGAALFLLVVLKDLAMYPVMKEAFQPSDLLRERLIGARGRAVEALAPTGYVRVSGELWRAEPRDPEKAIPPGAEVVIVEARGLTLVVDRAP